MNEPLFTGVCTALVTPFQNGKVNYTMLGKLLDRQMEADIHQVVICGTTGEAPTLSDEEKLTLIQKAKEHVKDDCMILAGTGTNSTQHAVTLSRAAEEVGADGLLLVSPYYNKATAEGLLLHYSAIASTVHIPIILYNVPSRTGVDISVDVCEKLSKFPNVAGIKEASTDITKVAKLRAACPYPFSVWSGNDDMAVPAIALGAMGVISVISNVLPMQTQMMVQAALDGDFDTAASLHLEFLPLMELLFSEVNPIPVKAAMKCVGYDCGPCRPPLTPMNPLTLKRMESFLRL